MQQAGEALPDGLASVVAKLDNLAAGKPPSPAELEPFRSAASAKLQEDIQRANFTLGGPKGSSGAESAINQGRLNSQLLAEEVASGHAFQKHVVERQEFAVLGISTKSQFQSFLEKIVSNPAIERRQAVDGTVYYLDSATKTIVIRGQRGEATAFRPDKGGVGWENYIESQVPKK